MRLNVTGANSIEEWILAHALSQQAVCETLLPSHRAELHEHVAESLERLFPDEVEALTCHYERSRNHSKAVEYLRATGEKTMNAFLAVWLLVARAVESGGLSEARKHLCYLTPPWERAMREELRKCVEKALRSDSEVRDFREAIRLVRREHLA